MKEQTNAIGIIKWHDKNAAMDEFEYETFTSLDQMCYTMALFYCWNDCDDSYDIVEATWDGKKVSYAGWLPQMQFDFYCDGELVWRNWFPNWDH